MKLLFPEYAPDVTPFGEEEAAIIQNGFPRKDGYGPVPTPSDYSTALPGPNRGYFFARNADSSVTIFAGTKDRLFKLNGTDLSWIPVSKSEAVTSISDATPAVVTLTAHGQSIWDAVVFTTTGTLPSPLVAGTVYYVITAGFTSGAFEISATKGGAAINTTTAGSGTHSITGAYTALPTADQWQFAQFNNFVFAVQINVPPQVYDLTASTTFADLAGSPPQARYISIVNRFVVLTGLGTATPYRIQWSGLNATTTWTSGVNSSDFQDFPDGGITRGVAGSEYGATVFQEAAIRRMVYVGGTLIFQFERISDEKGIFAPLSAVTSGENVFYCGSDGFKMLAQGGYPQAIGKERVDRTFFNEVDSSALQYIIGASDPRATRVFWSYKSQSGMAGQFDKVLVYDYAINRWSLIVGWGGQYIATLAVPGLTLEGLDAIAPGDSIDALTFSLDDVALSAFLRLSIFDTTNVLNFCSGPALDAIFETSEHEMDGGRRVRVGGFRPETDALGCGGMIGHRENLQTSAIYSTEQIVDSQGRCWANVSTRIARGRVHIPAGTVWTFAQGVEPFFVQEGQR